MKIALTVTVEVDDRFDPDIAESVAIMLEGEDIATMWDGDEAFVATVVSCEVTDISGGSL